MYRVTKIRFINILTYSILDKRKGRPTMGLLQTVSAILCYYYSKCKIQNSAESLWIFTEKKKSSSGGQPVTHQGESKAHFIHWNIRMYVGKLRSPLKQFQTKKPSTYWPKHFLSFILKLLSYTLTNGYIKLAEKHW